MISFKDRSFSASPDCKNECGRKLTPELMREYEIANLPENWDGMLTISYGYFCGGKLDLLPGITLTGNATVKMGAGFLVGFLDETK